MHLGMRGVEEVCGGGSLVGWWVGVVFGQRVDRRIRRGKVGIWSELVLLFMLAQLQWLR